MTFTLKVTPKTQGGIGFKANWLVKMARKLCRVLIQGLRLNGENFFSNEFIQCLDPKSAVDWNRGTLFFRTGHGRLKWRVDSFATEEPLMIEWLSEFGKDDVFLDVGANVGIYTVPAATLAGRVIAVELDPSNVGILYENCFLNKLTEKVVIVPLGVGDRNSVELVYYRDFSKGDALQSVARPSPFQTRTTSNAHKCLQAIASLDSIFDIFGLPQPNKIKIDVDGNERAVFDGGRRVILAASEIYFEDCQTEDSDYVLDCLYAAGFTVSRKLATGNENFGGSANLVLVRK